ncbi:MAG: hypothetical protein K1X88_31735 [Nannocystaceae bacterium]|nr:hypothetical protein [Nannocystaceae bacterium]
MQRVTATPRARALVLLASLMAFGCDPEELPDDVDFREVAEAVDLVCDPGDLVFSDADKACTYELNTRWDNIDRPVSVTRCTHGPNGDGWMPANTTYTFDIMRTCLYDNTGETILAQCDVVANDAPCPDRQDIRKTASCSIENPTGQSFQLTQQMCQTAVDNCYKRTMLACDPSYSQIQPVPVACGVCGGSSDPSDPTSVSPEDGAVPVDEEP